jgi:CheY-like chemotaxis protein
VARILVGEDDEASAILVKAVLTHAGHQVTVGADGPAVLALAKEPYDLILLDMQMPGLSGFEVLSQLRADGQRQSVPILMVSASALPSAREQALRIGFDGFLTKPVSPALLRDEVARYLAAGGGNATRT